MKEIISPPKQRLHKNPPHRNVFGVVLKLFYSMDRKQMKASVSDAGLCDEDMVHILSVLSRSRSSSVFKADPRHPMCRTLPGDFVAWLRFHVGLPQLLRSPDEAVKLPGSDVVVNKCAVNHETDCA